MIEWILTSSVLILVVLGLRAALKGHISQRLRYCLWVLVLIRLLIPFSLTDSAISVTSLAGQRIQDIETVVETPIRSEGYEAALQEVMANFHSQQIDPADIPEGQLNQAIRENIYQQILSEQGNTPISQEELDARVNSRMESIYSIDPKEVLSTLWFTGIALMCAVFLWSNARLALNLRRTRTRLEISHSLPVYVTDYVATPCLFGLVRSVIYLPHDAAASPHLDHILAHETTHHRHGDHIWSVLRCAALALHWYNPLVWIAASASKKDAELACDKATIALLGEHQRTAYGETLITMTCARRGHKDLFLTATTMNTGKRTLKERVTMIAKHPKTAIYTLTVVLLVMAIAAGCTFTGAGNQSATPDTTEPPATTAPTTPTTTVPVEEEIPDMTEPDVAFPEGEIQAVLLFVNNRLYARSETALDAKLPNGYRLAGTVQEVNNRREPAENFHAAHLSAGTEVYTAKDTTRVYVKDTETGYYRRMYRADISGDWWSKPFKVNPISGFEPEGELLSSGAMHSAQQKFDTLETLYLQAVTSLYDSPEKMDLCQFFYNGIPGADNTLSQEEADYLKSIHAYADVDVARLPAEEMDIILQTTFGISLQEANQDSLADLPYWEETDCYYLFRGDTNLQSVKVHSAYTHGVYVDIYYCTHSGDATPDYVLTQKSIGGGVWIVSNKVVEVRPEYNGFIPEGEAMSNEAAAEIASLFDDYRSWYTMATASIFSTPEDAELNLLFYNGIPPEETTLTTREKNFLRNTWLGEYIGELEFTRIPADGMNDVLEEYFGISLEESTLRGTQNWVYWDDTDCYYMAHNDSIAQDVDVLSVFIRSGGLVDVYYRVNGEYYVMTLRAQGSRFVICANWYVNNMTTLPSTGTKHGIYFPYDPAVSAVVPLTEEELAYFNGLFENCLAEESVLASFFNVYFDAPEELDLEAFLRYNCLAQAVTSGGDFDTICQREGFADFVPVPIHKYAANEVDAALKTFLGIGLEDLNSRRGKGSLHYLSQYDAYYNTTSDAGWKFFIADRGERELNTIRLYDDHNDGSISILTLRCDGEKWLIVSHQLAVP